MQYILSGTMPIDNSMHRQLCIHGLLQGGLSMIDVTFFFLSTISTESRGPPRTELTLDLFVQDVQIVQNSAKQERVLRSTAVLSLRDQISSPFRIRKTIQI